MIIIIVNIFVTIHWSELIKEKIYRKPPDLLNFHSENIFFIFFFILFFIKFGTSGGYPRLKILRKSPRKSTDLDEYIILEPKKKFQL